MALLTYLQHNSSWRRIINTFWVSANLVTTMVSRWFDC